MVGGATTIILCRHGESADNHERRFSGHSDTPLTERGLAQALATGRVVAELRADCLYTSDLPRAVQTAGAIAAATGLVPRLSAALRERSVGKLTGLTFGEAEACFPDAFSALLRREPNACPPGGESYAQCRARAAAFLEEVLIEHAGACVVVVSHHITIYQLVLHILGLYDAREPPRVSFQLDNCALHRLERLENHEWRVLALNERAHLADATLGCSLRAQSA
jgi:broad specificity phosphatase PhoE